MDLKEVRIKINQIDEELKEQFNQRLECSAQVAGVKMQSNDEVYKPLREKEIYARYDDDSLGRNHKSYMKKIIQLSRKYQYTKFIEANIVDEGFYSWIEDSTPFRKGGPLNLYLKADPEGERGLDINNILEIVADTSLRLMSVSARHETQCVNVSFMVEDTDACRQEAFVVAYMLYKETIKE